MEAPTTDVVPSVEATFPSHDEPADPKPALTPPTSEDMDKRGERMSSELSELESSDDEEEIEPDHYFDGGKIPVFKPVCLRNFCVPAWSFALRRILLWACAPAKLTMLMVRCIDHGPI